MALSSLCKTWGVRTLAGLLVAMALLAGCGGSDESGDLIAFNSDRDGDMEVFVMNPDGTEVRQLTDNNMTDFRSFIMNAL